jgi:ammonia channel protein AmtB
MFTKLLTGLFAQASIAGLDGITKIPGGWLDHNYIQLAWQLADSVTGLSYSFVMTVRIRLNCVAVYSDTNLVRLNELDGASMDHALHPLHAPPR